MYHCYSQYSQWYKLQKEKYFTNEILTRERQKVTAKQEAQRRHIEGYPKDQGRDI